MSANEEYNDGVSSSSVHNNNNNNNNSVRHSSLSSNQIRSRDDVRVEHVPMIQRARLSSIQDVDDDDNNDGDVDGDVDMDVDDDYSEVVGPSSSSAYTSRDSDNSNNQRVYVRARTTSQPRRSSSSSSNSQSKNRSHRSNNKNPSRQQQQLSDSNESSGGPQVIVVAEQPQPQPPKRPTNPTDVLVGNIFDALLTQQGQSLLDNFSFQVALPTLVKIMELIESQQLSSALKSVRKDVCIAVFRKVVSAAPYLSKPQKEKILEWPIDAAIEVIIGASHNIFQFNTSSSSKTGKMMKALCCFK